MNEYKAITMAIEELKIKRDILEDKIHKEQTELKELTDCMVELDKRKNDIYDLEQPF